MKKTLLILILSVYTWDIIHADVVWNLSDNGTLTISGTEMSNYDVQKAPWCSQRKNIKNVVIEKGVKNIGNYAFYRCSSLVSVSIPNSVTSIGEYAFIGCCSLVSVDIPNSVMDIRMCAFSGCSSLTSVISPNSVTYIGNSAFAY